MNFLRREISDAFHWLLIINALLPAQLCWCCLGTLCCCHRAVSRHWQLWVTRLQCQHCWQDSRVQLGWRGWPWALQDEFCVWCWALMGQEG